jgi:hypothetical protein
MNIHERCLPHQFQIDSLPYSELPNTSFLPRRLADTTVPADGDGVVMWEYDGELYYHPVTICHRAYQLILAYRETGDTTYLGLAERSVLRLIAESREFGGALYYPYHFDFRAHRLKEGALRAPWYSGMAQGEILGLFVRMFWVTGDSSYCRYAHKTFKSFLRPRGEAEPWTVYFDWRGCYWIEEYTTDVPSQTLNGFIYALYGVYDYWLMTHSRNAEEVLQDCLSTIRNYLPYYRRPGQPSFYGLRFRYYARGYHYVHIDQLRQLYKITGDGFFRDWADTLQSDITW